MFVNRVLGVGVVCAVLTIGLSALANDDPARKPDKGKPPPVDLSKLPPEVAKKVQEALEKGAKKPDDRKSEEDLKKLLSIKSISLIEAIQLTEKATQGQVTKAERKLKDDQVLFTIDVIDKEGRKYKIELDAAGKLLEKKDDKKPEPKSPKPEK